MQKQDLKSALKNKKNKEYSPVSAEFFWIILIFLVTDFTLNKTFDFQSLIKNTQVIIINHISH